MKLHYSCLGWESSLKRLYLSRSSECICLAQARPPRLSECDTKTQPNQYHAFHINKQLK